jgi:hypothetical protein
MDYTPVINNVPLTTTQIRERRYQRFKRIIEELDILNKELYSIQQRQSSLRLELSNLVMDIYPELSYK